MMRNHLVGIIVAFGLGLFLMMQFLLGCGEPDPIGADGIQGPERNPVGNLSPETYISLGLSPGQLPDTSISSKTVHWWGEDPDGWIEKYRYRWGLLEPDSLDSTAAPDTAWIEADWTETELDSGMFILPIRTASASFTFQVYAIDNMGAVDSSVAEITYPVVNSRPTIDFRILSNPLTVADTFYTFTTRTFAWDAYDPDGNETIEKIQYALNPADGDTDWVDLDGSLSTITLEELPVGDYVFWARVVDVAGFASPSIHFPDSTVTTDPNVWHVREPVGRYLIIDDAALQRNNEFLNFYMDIFDELYGEENYTVWELGEELPYSPVDTRANLFFFDRVLWFANQGSPLIADAFDPIYSYVESEDKRLLLTTLIVFPGMVGLQDSTEGEIEGGFEPLADSMWVVDAPQGRLRPNDVYLIPDDGAGLDSLELTTTILFGIRHFNPTAGVQSLYHLGANAQYTGEPIVGLRREYSATNSSYTVITVPLASFDGRENVKDVIRVVLDE